MTWAEAQARKKQRAEEQQRREELKELARGPMDLPFLLLVVLLTGIVSGAVILLLTGTVSATEILTNMGSGVAGMFETAMVAVLVSIGFSSLFGWVWIRHIRGDLPDPGALLAFCLRRCRSHGHDFVSGPERPVSKKQIRRAFRSPSLLR